MKLTIQLALVGIMLTGCATNKASSIAKNPPPQQRTYHGSSGAVSNALGKALLAQGYELAAATAIAGVVKAGKDINGGAGQSALAWVTNGITRTKTRREATAILSPAEGRTVEVSLTITDVGIDSNGQRMNSPTQVQDPAVYIGLFDDVEHALTAERK